jgi:hypothetical protein
MFRPIPRFSCAFRRRHVDRKSAARRRAHPQVEPLEQHLLLTTFTVTSTADSGPCTLRAAILAANGDPIANGQDAIVFDFPAGAGDTIQPLSSLPAVTRENVTMSGPLTLDGSLCNGCIGLDFEGYEDNVIDLTVEHFGGGGIVLSGQYDLANTLVVIENGEFGISVTGTYANVTGDGVTDNGGDGIDFSGSFDFIGGVRITGNGGDGVDITGNDNRVGSPSQSILSGAQIGPEASLPGGGNWISSNGNSGVEITAGGAGNAVYNNLIGTDYFGESADPNAWSGVYIYNAPNNSIGGTVPGDGNLISGNGNNGITIAGAASTDEVVQANKIGTDGTGENALGNAWSGIFVGESDSTGSASDVLIGGTVGGYGNLISANGNYGVWIRGQGANDVSIEGNYIGTDATGDQALGNAWGGMDVAGGASFNSITGDLVSGNPTFDGIGISDPGTTGNLVADDLIGTNAAGTASLPNGFDGVGIVNGASDNTVGGTSGLLRNIISGNPAGGVSIDDPGTTGNVVQGNYVGTDITGTQPLGNGNSGVWLTNGATGNLIGGTAPGAGNTIAANQWDGVALVNSGTTGNVVEGNLIGTDCTGENPLGNYDCGVAIYGGASDNFVGSPVAGGLNVIDANGASGFPGIGISGTGTAGNVVQNNRIGTDASGTMSIGNVVDGIDIWGGAADNLIGGPTPGDGNVISANGGSGVTLAYAGTSGNLIQGNDIGTNLDGNSALANAKYGVGIYAGATGNLIGGETPGDENVISGNDLDGVFFTDQGTSGNVVERNFIGTDVTGTLPLGNGQNGVEIANGASNNQVGDADTAGLNLISANLLDGIAIDGAGTSGNVVEGDRIGTDITGTLDLGNAGDGVAISAGASSNSIGLAVVGAENVISGNFLQGVSLSGNGTSRNVVARNFIGTDVYGASAVGNLEGGVAIFGGASDNLIGSTAEGGGNFISGNGFAGVKGSFSGVAIAGNGTDGNLVQHNYIGLAASGSFALPNAADGVDVFGGADANTIGGAERHSENLISGNLAAGVVIADQTTNRNVVEGNLIGTDYSGTAAVPNGSDGVQLLNTHSNVIGGTGSLYSYNFIAGNAGSGISLITAVDNVVKGNFIGVDLDGGALGNQGDGVDVSAASSDNVIGGTSPLSQNVIDANGLDGVEIQGAGTSHNHVEGNLIGVGPNGSTEMGNGGDGVRIQSDASQNVIGGTVAGSANIIAYNGGNGVTVGANVSDRSIDDAVLENSIFGNAALGIDLGDDGVTQNGSDGDSGPNLFQYFPVLSAAVTTGATTTITGTLAGAPNTTYQVELFTNPTADASGYGQGQVFLVSAAVTTSSSGAATFTVTTATVVAAGWWVSSTATDPNGNTSEFSADVQVMTSTSGSTRPADTQENTGIQAAEAVIVKPLVPSSRSASPKGAAIQALDYLLAIPQEKPLDGAHVGELASEQVSSRLGHHSRLGSRWAASTDS